MQRRVTDALTRALFVEWARVGYAALSLEAVAKRAGVGKALFIAAGPRNSPWSRTDWKP